MQDKIQSLHFKPGQLPDHTIHIYSKLGMIDPYDESLLQPTSYDLTLGSHFLIPSVQRTNGNPELLTVGTDKPEYLAVEGPRYLRPRDFILAETEQYLRLPPDIAGKFEGKSSLGRIGLMTHITAGFIDPGFHGKLTLEIHNSGPWNLRLNPGIRIGQVVFNKLSEPCSRPYGHKDLHSHYQNSDTVRGYQV